MNDWKKQIVFTNWYYVFGYFIPILFIFSMVIHDIWLFSISILLLLLFLANYAYLLYCSKHIHIAPEKIIRKAFPGESVSLEIPLENHGRIPVFYMGGIFHLYSLDEAIALSHAEEEESSLYKYFANITLPNQRKQNIVLNIKALKRGTGEIREIHIEIYDFLKLFHVNLRYEGSYRGEVIVYPKPIQVKGLEQIVQQLKGEQLQTFSVYEDVMRIRGTREYASNDPFNRIHWKASARTNELQTKIYEHVNISKWTIIVNVRSEKNLHTLVPTISNLERVLSEVAYTCQFATKHAISFEMYINVKSINSRNGMYLPLNNGSKHLQKALEMLARIKKSSFTISTEKIIKSLVNDWLPPSLVLHFGPYHQGDVRAYQALNHTGGRVVFIHGQEEVEINDRDSRGDRREASS